MTELTGCAPLLQVYDMPAAVAFYRDALGFDLAEQSPEIEDGGRLYFHWCLLRRGSIELMLNTAYDPGERPPQRDAARQAAHGDICLYLGCPDPDAAWRDLTVSGLVLDPPRTAPYGMRQLQLHDPDGYAICLQSPVSG